MTKKTFPKKDPAWKLAWASILISSFIVGMVILASLFIDGFESTLRRWFVYLGFLIICIILMFFSLWIAVWVDCRISEKNDASEDDSENG